MIPQGEGGEQGDPLMPLLFSLGMHPALVAAQRRLRPSERIFAFLDDVCVARSDSGPPRQDTSVESCGRGASRYGGVDRQSTSCGPGGSGLEG